MVKECGLEEAKRKLLKVKEWAESRNLSWTMETVFKKWLEIDSLEVHRDYILCHDGTKAVKRKDVWYDYDNKFVVINTAYYPELKGI